MSEYPQTIAEIDARWWCAAATPWGVMHQVCSPDGSIRERALCGFRPRHGWAIYENVPPVGEHRDCERCLARACRRDARDEARLAPTPPAGGGGGGPSRSEMP